MWNGDDYLERLYQEAKDDRKKIATEETPSEHKERLRQVLKDSLGKFDRLPKAKVVPLEEEAAFEGYTRRRVELTVVPGLSFGAYILTPTGVTGKLPGVVAVHGHGFGSRQICGMLSDGTMDTGEPDLYKHFAIQLVRKGMVVIAPDVIGFGERLMQADIMENPDTPSSCYRMSTQLLMYGKTLTGLRVTELMGTVDFFFGLEQIDPARVGIVGFSSGSLFSYIVSALDQRIKATVLIGFPNTFEESILKVHHCVCNFIPVLLSKAELPELMGLIAPRPLFLESGDKDPLFPETGFRRAVEYLQAVYRRENAEKHLAYDLFPGVHEVSGRRSFEWLKQTLQ
ncbi:dienelactone hydrolase family protein [Paenibacillus ferrarius]|uniref:dienelactone hydrolase family protein n=1 Tax=Paenibacillus ferrarius TaxID=1469647 RepID=UPI003D2D14E4